jgi:HK97 family phage portal protein
MALIIRNPFKMISSQKTAMTNLFNEAFFSFLGGSYTKYDNNNISYVQKAYNHNSDVYSLVSQIARKFASVPSILKTVEDKKAFKSFEKLYTKSLGAAELANKRIYEKKAFNEIEIDDPLTKPNYYQNDTEFKELWETFMLLTGNAYQYILSPKEGANTGKPMQRFLLPAHLMQIVLKPEAKFIELESPIDYYILTIGNVYIKFKEEDIIHSKYANPNYDLSGSHLYGRSPLAAILLDIQLQNVINDNSIKTIKSGGSYGFIHAKDGQTPLTPDQATDIKSRLIEMQASEDNLGRIAGSSAPLGFTKVSVDTKDLQPLEFKKDAQKSICNALGWSDKLLNNDDGAKYDNMNAAWVQAISNRIAPDLKIYEDALNNSYYPRFKDLGNVKCIFDISELPEMQGDMKTLCEWLAIALDNAAITPEEFRVALRYPETGKSEMKQHFIKTGLIPLEDALISDLSISKAFNLGA